MSPVAAGAAAANPLETGARLVRGARSAQQHILGDAHALAAATATSSPAPMALKPVAMAEPQMLGSVVQPGCHKLQEEWRSSSLVLPCIPFLLLKSQHRSPLQARVELLSQQHIPFLLLKSQHQSPLQARVELLSQQHIPMNAPQQHQLCALKELPLTHVTKGSPPHKRQMSLPLRDPSLHLLARPHLPCHARKLPIKRRIQSLVQLLHHMSLM
jgi:hypothetical protein